MLIEAQKKIKGMSEEEFCLRLKEEVRGNLMGNFERKQSEVDGWIDFIFEGGKDQKKIKAFLLILREKVGGPEA